jgi:uncharacterized Zn-finger protein
LWRGNPYHPLREWINVRPYRFAQRFFPSRIEMQPFETIYIDSMVAACNGGGGPLGHPRVYLNLATDGKIECPYCSRLFVYDAAHAGGRDAATPGADGKLSATGEDHPPPGTPAPASPGVPPPSPAKAGAVSSSANPAKS